MIYFTIFLILLILFVCYKFNKLVDMLEISAEESMFFFSRKNNKID